jgi:hypothetical protein
MEVLLKVGCFYVARAEELYGIHLDRPNQFCMGVCEERTWVHEAEKSTLLKSITNKYLVKTLQAREDLVCALLICKVWKLAIVL